MDPTRRQAYLQALGIPALVRRDAAGAALSGGTVAEPEPAPVARPAVAASPTRVGLGDGDVRPSRPAQTQTPPVPVRSDETATLDWEALRSRVGQCRACGLHEGRTQAVFGVGNQGADLMIIGEGPGADEDRQGEPFVGRAGQLLNAMLRAIGLAREQVYIANVVKCRPPGNRNPAAEEIAACRGYLQRQISLVEPRLILSLGAVSAHSLLDSDDPVGRLRMRTHHLGQARIPLLVSYHPAYLLRKPAEKAKAWEDLQQVARLLG